MTNRELGAKRRAYLWKVCARRLQTGEPLPSLQALARDLGCEASNVWHHFQQMQRQGLAIQQIGESWRPVNYVVKLPR